MPSKRSLFSFLSLVVASFAHLITFMLITSMNSTIMQLSLLCSLLPLTTYAQTVYIDKLFVNQCQGMCNAIEARGLGSDASISH
mmetsp:Transcript_26200/g.43731  ORF Transcript_26200/g.43731 Transcript_26200/m.43731 type:complete len:84 (+) Transcript_26200:757-1008(+)